MNLVSIIKQHWIEHCNKRNKELIYIKLKDVIKSIIQDRKNGFSEIKLPSTRILAESLNLSRSTILKTYELLIFEKIIISKKGSGYYINEYNVENNQNVNVFEKNKYPSFSKTGETFVNNVHLLDNNLNTNISFRPGLPPLDIFPIKQWTKLYNAYWKNLKSSQLNYSNVSGVDNLKINIANYLYYTRGINCNYEQIFIVSGSLQSLFLIATSLINKGDNVIIENPTFPNVHSIFKSLNTKLQSIDIDEEGIKINSFDENTFPKIIHVTPSNQYPLGVAMSIQRKKELLNWAKKKSSIIIENDYENDINNYGIQNPSLFQLDKDNRVIYLGTFNRLLHPSIRIGYMIVPEYLLDVIKALQKHSHQFVSPTNQFVMSEFIRHNYLVQHIRNVAEVEEERRQIFINSIKDNIHPSFYIQSNKIKSLHLLANIPNHLSDKKLVNDLQKNNINVSSLSKLNTANNSNQGVILGHTATNKHLMPSKIKDFVDTYNNFFMLNNF